ncbi:helix-turn-helix domain-containing protein [Lysinibacillus sp. NPDC097162]|uniref:helix-turn-helix domain-containing protein n=1 Tax=Lysinibacillus sp. NPDC097162 TaxID=3364140 RepID=UPI003828FFB7
MQVIDYRTTKFVMIPQSLARDKTLSHRDKIVYMTLCLYSDNASKQSYPSAQTIADVAGIGRNGVFKAFAALEKLGYIRREKRTYKGGKQTTNTYYLLDK